MSRILISLNKEKHPIESCASDLVSLIDDINNARSDPYDTPYREILQMGAELENSPEENLSSFNEKYAFIQSQHNRLTSIIIELRMELKRWQIYKSRLKILYRKARNLLLTSRDDIKTLRNKELQEAAIQTELDNIIDLLDGLDIVIEDLQYTSEIAMLKKDQLDKINMNINRQQKVVEDMIFLNHPVVTKPGVRIIPKHS